MIKYRTQDVNEALMIGKKNAYKYKPNSEHIETEYDIVEDTTTNDERVIRLKKRDLTETKAKVKEVVDMILADIDEKDSKTMKELLIDTIGDYSDKSLDKIKQKLSTGKQPAKTREGCFNIIIGDGRRKNSEYIRIR